MQNNKNTKSQFISLMKTKILSSSVDGDGNLYVTFSDGDKQTTVSLESGEALTIMLRAAHEAGLLIDFTINSKSIKAWMRDYIRAITYDKSETYQRVGVEFNKDSNDIENLYVKLNNSEVVKVSAKGYEVIKASECSVKFIHSDSSLDMPIPVFGGNIDMLKSLINFESEDDFRLMIVYILYCFFPGNYGAKPILVLEGSQGSGKSKASEMLKQLIDPSKYPLSTIANEEDIMLQAKFDWVTVLDNLSNITKTLADILCKAATGGVFFKRKLHTDGEIYSVSFKKPLILNGINALIKREDFADRCILINLPKITKRISEVELNARFEKVRPMLLGALFELLSKVIAALPKISDYSLPRMADFARVGIAVSDALGWVDGWENTFLRIYTDNRKKIVFNSLERDILARCIVSMLDDMEVHGPTFEYVSIYGFPHIIEGTCTTLLPQFRQYCAKTFPFSERFLPESPESLGRALHRLEGHLDKIGITIDYEKDRSCRKYTIYHKDRNKLSQVSHFIQERQSDSCDGSILSLV